VKSVWKEYYWRETDDKLSVLIKITHLSFLICQYRWQCKNQVAHLFFYFFFVINLQIAILLHLFKNDKCSMSGFALNFINGLVFVSSSLTKTCGRDQNYFESFWGKPLQLIKHTICPCAFHTRRVNCYIISSSNMQRIPYRRLVNTVSPVDRVQL